ncbi:preprotein translocase subunit YajC [Microbacterium sp.]|uniref:preprotein translocase subunit YajC n=1 Tax=Microbacterium sp. TaxID=51671 RepID=UPI003A890E53
MLFAATSTPAPQPEGVGGFFSQYGLLILLLGLIVFMFWSSRRRQARMKAEQEEKATKMVPGAKVLLQGGLYGTIVDFDGDDLSLPARVEIAPGVVIEVHSQAVLRIVEDEPTTDPIPGDDLIPDSVAQDTTESASEQTAGDDSDADSDTDDAPKS